MRTTISSWSEALALAHKEFEVRHDIYTWDALAWALYKNGKYQEASDAIDNALRPGTRDALLFFHAGMIASRLGQTSQAKERLQTALSINPQFHVIYSDVARQQLKMLQDQAGLDREPRTDSCSVSDSTFLFCWPSACCSGRGALLIPWATSASITTRKSRSSSDGIRVSYIIDLAEIPTYQELQQGNVTADVADPAVTRFVESRGRGIRTRPQPDARRQARCPCGSVSSQVIFPPGAGGLPTMKMGFVYQAAYPAMVRPATCSMPTITFPVTPDGKRLSLLAIPGLVSPAARCRKPTAAPS